MGFSDILGVGALGTGILGSILSSRNQSKLIKLQQQENQLNRDFNAEQAQLSRDFATDMFNRTNEYNSPVNAVSRLRSAGLNPALAISTGFLGSQAAATSPSGAASSAGSISVPPLDYSGIAQSPLIAAQVAKTKAETNEINSRIPLQTRLMSLDADFKSIGIDLSKFDLENMKPQELNNLIKTGEQISALTDSIVQQGSLTEAQIRDVTASAKSKEIANRYAPQLNEVSIAEMRSKVGLDEATTLRLSALLAGEIAQQKATLADTYASVRQKDSQTSVNTETARGLNFANMLSESNLKKWGLDYLSDKQISSFEAYCNKAADDFSNGNYLSGSKNFLMSFLSLGSDFLKGIVQVGK